MEAPVIIPQRRRPFLAPIWISALLVLVAVGIVATGYRSLTTTTIVVTRHAEKVVGGIPDAPLTPEGELRAQRLAGVFGVSDTVGRLDAIYILNTRSAQQTAAPLVSRLQLQPVLVPIGELHGIASRILRAHRGRTVLLIVDSTAVSAAVRKLGRVTIPAASAEDYGSAYAVSVPSIGRSNVFKIKY